MVRHVFLGIILVLFISTVGFNQDTSSSESSGIRYFTGYKRLPNGQIQFTHPVEEPKPYGYFYEERFEPYHRYRIRSIYGQTSYGLIRQVYRFDIYNRLMYRALYNIRGELSSYFAYFYDGDSKRIRVIQHLSHEDTLLFRIEPTYDEYNRLRSEHYQYADGTLHIKQEYEWDHGNNLIHVKTLDTNGYGIADVTMEYDEIQRLQTRSYWSPLGNEAVRLEYEYPMPNEIVITGYNTTQEEPLLKIKIEKDEWGRIVHYAFFHRQYDAWTGAPSIHIDYNEYGFPETVHQVNTYGNATSTAVEYTTDGLYWATDCITQTQHQLVNENWFQEYFQRIPTPSTSHIQHLYEFVLEDLRTLPGTSTLQHRYEPFLHLSD
jgi:hypothetical protein